MSQNNRKASIAVADSRIVDSSIGLTDENGTDIIDLYDPEVDSPTNDTIVGNDHDPSDVGDTDDDSDDALGDSIIPFLANTPHLKPSHSHKSVAATHGKPPARHSPRTHKLARGLNVPVEAVSETAAKGGNR